MAVVPLPDALAIAARLRDIASGLKLAGGSRFRVTAYERGAEALEAFTGDLDRWIREGRLLEIPGIGDKLAGVIAELRETGASRLLASVSEGLPPGALELARGPRLSLRAIRTLSEANIRSLDDLRNAAKQGRLRALRGFSAKTEARILSEMSEAEGSEGLTRLAEAMAIAEHAAAFLKRRQDASGAEVDVVGDVRRGLEVVDVVSLLVSTADPRAALERFETYPRLLAIERPNETIRCGRLSKGARLRLQAVQPSARAAALQRLTGSVAHNEAFDRAASRAGIVVELSGVYASAAGLGTRAPLAVASEEAVYAHAGLAYVPPELRDGADEIDLAARSAVPRLVEIAHIRGMVHCHTNYSDGRHTIEQMARAAEARGMRYLTITDHSPTAHYAGGVEVDRLKKQWDEIARVQEMVTIRILRGTESDILEDGSLDYPDAVLERLDIIVASIHNRYRLDERAMTERVVRAMRHPLFKVWGHALGRLLLHRPPIACDVDAILDAAAESRAIIEISGDPFRLDMPPLLARRARARGISFVVSVDAHSIRDFDHLGLGVTMARRAILEARHVLNTREVDEFIQAVRPTG